MKVDGDYTGKFADPFYGYDPTVEMMQKTTSWAVFAQDEWQIADAWKLIGGVRYWKDDREGGYFGTAAGIDGLDGPVTIIFNKHEVSPLGSSITPGDATRSFDGVTARVQVDWKPTDDLLWYLSYNRGSKSGGFTFSTGTPLRSGRQPGNPRAFLEGMPFKPETLDAYELGMKSTLGGTTTLEHQRVLLRLHRLPGVRAGTVRSRRSINLDANETGLEAELTSRPLDRD